MIFFRDIRNSNELIPIHVVYAESNEEAKQIIT